jgi:endonuclease YncB( thermonuclease family)
MPLLIRSFAAALALFALTSLADAQSVRLRGTIESVAGDTLVVHTREGDTATVHLKPGAAIGALIKAQLSDIKPGLFIGAAALPGADGALKAMEVHIFPEAMRGTGEGFRPFDLAPNSSMTNGNISAAVDTVDGPKLTVTYKGGEQTIVVDKQTPIVMLVAGGADDLKAGAGVIVFASAKGADGAYEAGRLIVGRDGVKPPM